MRKELFLLGTVIGMVLILGIANALEPPPREPVEQPTVENEAENVNTANQRLQPVPVYDEEDEWMYVGGASTRPSVDSSRQRYQEYVAQRESYRSQRRPVSRQQHQNCVQGCDRSDQYIQSRTGYPDQRVNEYPRHRAQQYSEPRY